MLNILTASGTRATVGAKSIINGWVAPYDLHIKTVGFVAVSSKYYACSVVVGAAAKTVRSSNAIACPNSLGQTDRHRAAVKDIWMKAGERLFCNITFNVAADVGYATVVYEVLE